MFHVNCGSTACLMVEWWNDLATLIIPGVLLYLEIKGGAI